MNFADMFGLSVPSFMYTSDSIQDIFNKNKDTFKLDISTYAKTGFNLNIFAGDTWIHNDTSITFKIERTNNPFGPKNPVPVVVTTQTPCAIDHGVKGLVLFHKGDKKYEDIAVPLGGIGQFGYSQLDGVLHVEAEAIYLDNKAAAVRLTFRLNQNILNSNQNYVKTITLHEMAGYLVTGVYLPPIPSNKPNPEPQPEPEPEPQPEPEPEPHPTPGGTPRYVKVSIKTSVGNCKVVLSKSVGWASTVANGMPAPHEEVVHTYYTDSNGNLTITVPSSTSYVSDDVRHFTDYSLSISKHGYRFKQKMYNGQIMYQDSYYYEISSKPNQSITVIAVPKSPTPPTPPSPNEPYQPTPPSPNEPYQPTPPSPNEPYQPTPPSPNEPYQPYYPNNPYYGQYIQDSSGSGIDTKTMLMIGAIAVVAIFIFLKK